MKQVLLQRRKLRPVEIIELFRSAQQVRKAGCGWAVILTCFLYHGAETPRGVTALSHLDRGQPARDIMKKRQLMLEMFMDYLLVIKGKAMGNQDTDSEAAKDTNHQWLSFTASFFLLGQFASTSPWFLTEHLSPPQPCLCSETHYYKQSVRLWWTWLPSVSKGLRKKQKILSKAATWESMVRTFFFFFWNILDMQRQKGSLHLAELFCRQNQGATVRGSDPMCGHSALLCSVATAHALNRGQTSHNACDTLLWRLWEWRNKVWVNQFSSQSLIRGAAQNTHPEGSGITCRLRHSSITVL